VLQSGVVRPVVATATRAFVAALCAAGCERDMPVPMEPPAAPGAMAPNLLAADGDVLATWLEPSGAATRLRFARLTRTVPVALPWFSDYAWRDASTIVERTDLFSNWADVPSVVAAEDGTLFAHWLERTGDESYDAHVGRSTDGGATWNRVGRLHPKTPGEHGFVSLVAEGPREVRAVWLDGRDAARPGGATSLRTALIGDQVHDERVLDDRVCDCCGTAMVRTADGPIVAYRDREGEVRDIAIVRLTKSGWSRPAPLHADGWLVPGCPVNGPALAARGRRVVAAWYTYAGGNARVFAAFSHDAGATFGTLIEIDAPRGRATPVGRVDVALDGDHAIVSWMTSVRERAGVAVRRVAADGRRGGFMVLFVARAGRDAGFPRIEMHGGNLVLATTRPGSPSAISAQIVPPSWIPPLASKRDAPAAEVETVRPGSPAPDFSARTLRGEPRSLASLRNEVVLLNVWATWCEPCRHEIPELARLHERHAAEGLHVVGVSVDAGDAAAVAKFVARKKVPYAIWHDPDDRASAAFGIGALPATFLYDRSGSLRWHGQVPHGGSPDLDAALRAALAPPPAGTPDR
jgi:peroxiredoxin